MYLTDSKTGECVFISDEAVIELRDALNQGTLKRSYLHQLAEIQARLNGDGNDILVYNPEYGNGIYISSLRALKQIDAYLRADDTFQLR